MNSRVPSGVVGSSSPRSLRDSEPSGVQLHEVRGSGSISEGAPSTENDVFISTPRRVLSFAGSLYQNSRWKGHRTCSKHRGGYNAEFTTLDEA